MSNNAQYIGSGTDNGRNPSPSIWADCPLDDIMSNKPVGGNKRGTYFFDDFLDFPLPGTQTTQIGHGRYKLFCTAAGQIAPVKTVNSVVTPGGILSALCDTDNDSFSIGQAHPNVFLSGLSSTSGKMWFEARVAISSIATDGMGFFLGLAETDLWTFATGVPFNGGDAITNAAAAIGFHKGEDALGVINTVYSDRATSFTTIGASATSMTANTFIKLGMKYDPSNATECVAFYANNVKLTNVLSRAALTALTNLDSGSLGLLWAGVADTGGTAIRPYMDWWQLATLSA